MKTGGAAVAQFPEAMRAEGAWLVETSLPQAAPGLLPWACAHFTLSDGPAAGERFDPDYQPWVAKLLDCIDREGWRTIVLTAPAQSGKTTCTQILIAHGLFARRVKIVFGVPDIRMAAERWRENVLPAIVAAGFAESLPKSGPGSRGGRFDEAIALEGYGSIKPMGGGGGDAARSGYTAEQVVVIEADKLDVRGGSSREGRKLAQLRARLGAYDASGLFWAESTPSTSRGFVWQEIKAGTDSRIACPCPHCGEYVVLEREHLVGWREALDVRTARARAHWVCPACGVALDDGERREMARAGVVLHRGQRVDRAGKIVGETPPVETFGLRVTGFDNLLVSTGTLAADEWVAAQHPEDDFRQQELHQFRWALTWDPEVLDGSELDDAALRARTTETPRGMLPAQTAHLVAAVDIGKHLLHWCCVAFAGDGSPHVADYGVHEVHSDAMGEEQAVRIALHELAERFALGLGDAAGGAPRVPEFVLIDSGSGVHTDAVYAFVRQRDAAGGPTAYRASKGHGGSAGRPYARPKTTGSTILALGEGYHVAWLRERGVHLIEIDSGAWKSWAHARWSAPRGAAGAATLFAPDAGFSTHLKFTKHLVAERRTKRWVPGKGEVEAWQQVGRANHWLDAFAYAGVAGHLAGVRLLETGAPETTPGPAYTQRAARRAWRRF